MRNWGAEELAEMKTMKTLTRTMGFAAVAVAMETDRLHVSGAIVAAAHPVQRERGRLVDCAYRRVSVGAAHERSMEHARQAYVINEPAGSAQQREVFEASDAGAWTGAHLKSPFALSVVEG